MIALVGSVLTASLLGSPHCAGMCGGFVCFYAGHERGSVWTHAAYSAGRLLCYALLGAAAGSLGAGVDRWGGAAGLSHAAAVLAGAVMVAWGGVALLRAAGARLPVIDPPPALARIFGAALRGVRAQPPVTRALVVGLLTAFLPCGWLYAFVATAAGTGSALHGALVMAVFWAGTLPVMTGLGFAAQGALGPLRARLPALTGAVLVVLGLLTIMGKFHAVSAGSAGHVCH